jgi:hypothetical protein
LRPYIKPRTFAKRQCKVQWLTPSLESDANSRPFFWVDLTKESDRDQETVLPVLEESGSLLFSLLCLFGVKTVQNSEKSAAK